jgi:RNA recognition motif-containing protein
MGRTELFIGNLNKEIERKDIEDVFDKYGRLLRCEIKNKGMGSSFCFLEFEEEREAEVIIIYLLIPYFISFFRFFFVCFFI